jgi:hypothetical protein
VVKLCEFFLNLCLIVAAKDSAHVGVKINLIGLLIKKLCAIFVISEVARLTPCSAIGNS